MAALAAEPAHAMAGPFDGRWSVLIVTENGNCEVYRFGVQVANGRITTVETNTQMSGSISDKGSVNLNLASGPDTARATGRVSGGTGRGRWTSPTRQCSGRWEADKRS